MENDEDRVAVDLQLRALVRSMGVLDGEVVQAELALDAAEEVLVRLVEADPHEPVLARRLGPDLVDVEVGDAPPAAIGGAVHDHAAGAAGVVAHNCPLRQQS